MSGTLRGSLTTVGDSRRARRRRNKVVAAALAAGLVIAGLAARDATASKPAPPRPDTIVVVDDGGGFTILAELEEDSPTKHFYFGNPGDLALMGDWDCDGVSTPGVYRPAMSEFFLRNSNNGGPADISFVYGNPGDTPLAGDFNGSGCDSISVHRPNEARIYVHNSLRSGEADYAFYFGDLGDEPYVGDFNGNDVDSFGLRRERGRCRLHRSEQQDQRGRWRHVRQPGRPDRGRRLGWRRRFHDGCVPAVQRTSVLSQLEPQRRCRRFDLPGHGPARARCVGDRSGDDSGQASP